MNRISTGIKGVDKMLNGGIPSESVISLQGPAGVGKSLFALHFVYAGARNGEKSVYINLDEPRENVDRAIDSLEFGKEFLELEKAKKIRVLCVSYADYGDVYKEIFKQIENDKKIKRLVIDSFNGFFAYSQMGGLSEKDIGRSLELRKMLRNSFTLFRREGLTSLVVLEEDRNVKSEINSYINFLVDGIVSLDFISFGSIERRIFVPKMRWTKQYDSSLPYEVTEKGIAVKMEEE